MITMLEQKQIEEMSEDIAQMLCEAYRPNCDEYRPHTCSHCYVNSTPIGCFVEMLNQAGYRKQTEGEWLDAGYYIHNKRIYKCSECSKSEAKDALTSANYCPNCGAQMKGGAE